MSAEPKKSDHLLQMFAYEKLPPDLLELGKSFSDMAQQLCAAAPEDTDRYNALRDLLKSRDAALRSKMRAVTGSGPQAIDPKDDVL